MQILVIGVISFSSINARIFAANVSRESAVLTIKSPTPEVLRDIHLAQENGEWTFKPMKSGILHRQTAGIASLLEMRFLGEKGLNRERLKALFLAKEVSSGVRL